MRFYSETIAIGEKRPHYRTGLNSAYDKGQWGFIAKVQGWVVVRGWKITKRRHQR